MPIIRYLNGRSSEYGGYGWHRLADGTKLKYTPSDKDWNAQKSLRTGRYNNDIEVPIVKLCVDNKRIADWMLFQYQTVDYTDMGNGKRTPMSPYTFLQCLFLDKISGTDAMRAPFEMFNPAKENCALVDVPLYQKVANNGREEFTPAEYNVSELTPIETQSVGTYSNVKEAELALFIWRNCYIRRMGGNGQTVRATILPIEQIAQTLNKGMKFTAEKLNKMLPEPAKDVIGVAIGVPMSATNNFSDCALQIAYNDGNNLGCAVFENDTLVSCPNLGLPEDEMNMAKLLYNGSWPKAYDKLKQYLLVQVKDDQSDMYVKSVLADYNLLLKLFCIEKQQCTFKDIKGARYVLFNDKIPLAEIEVIMLDAEKKFYAETNCALTDDSNTDWLEYVIERYFATPDDELAALMIEYLKRMNADPLRCICLAANGGNDLRKAQIVDCFSKLLIIESLEDHKAKFAELCEINRERASTPRRTEAQILDAELRFFAEYDRLDGATEESKRGWLAYCINRYYAVQAQPLAKAIVDYIERIRYNEFSVIVMALQPQKPDAEMALIERFFKGVELLSLEDDVAKRKILIEKSADKRGLSDKIMLIAEKKLFSKPDMCEVSKDNIQFVLERYKKAYDEELQEIILNFVAQKKNICVEAVKQLTQEGIVDSKSKDLFMTATKSIGADDLTDEEIIAMRTNARRNNDVAELADFVERIILERADDFINGSDSVGGDEIMCYIKLMDENIKHRKLCEMLSKCKQRLSDEQVKEICSTKEKGLTEGCIKHLNLQVVDEIEVHELSMWALLLDNKQIAEYVAECATNSKFRPDSGTAKELFEFLKRQLDESNYCTAALTFYGNYGNCLADYEEIAASAMDSSLIHKYDIPQGEKLQKLLKRRYSELFTDRLNECTNVRAINEINLSAEYFDECFTDMDLEIMVDKTMITKLIGEKASLTKVRDVIYLLNDGNSKFPRLACAVANALKDYADSNYFKTAMHEKLVKFSNVEAARNEINACATALNIETSVVEDTLAAVNSIAEFASAIVHADSPEAFAKNMKLPEAGKLKDYIPGPAEYLKEAYEKNRRLKYAAALWLSVASKEEWPQMYFDICGVENEEMFIM